jgi:arabinogalactan endo-1,4-beta-galactosidase
MTMKQRTSRRVPWFLASSLLACGSQDRSAGLTPSPPLTSVGAGASNGAGGGSGGSLTEPPPAGEPANPPGNDEGNPTPGELVGVAGAPAIDPGAPPAGSGGATEQPSPEPPNVFEGRFILGADISSVDEAIDAGAIYVDTDGVEKSLIELLKNHGFNYIRLRTFVDPLAEFGYASGSGCPEKTEAYDDKEHTIAFAQQIKAAGMGFLLDFHYSDTWADPGKQVIPEAWRGVGSVDALAEQVRAYTVDVLTGLVAAGARPDMVQVGNEITPGMLIHVPTANTDCYGNDSVTNPGVNGSQNDWDNLAALLRAGIDGVRATDPSIQIMLHLENTESVGGVTDWVRNAEERGVRFDVLGLSAYEAFQGPSSEWRGTLQQLSTNLPNLSFAIAEYNPQRRLLNDIMRELPDGRGLGSFFWEPTQSGAWGASMFARQGNRLTANGDDFAEYDQMKADFGL